MISIQRANEQQTKMSFDGHYWVVRDGKIIDPMFKFYETVKRQWGCDEEIVNLPASPVAQAVFKKKQLGKVQMAKSCGFYHSLWDASQGFCDINAYHEQKMRGGEIVFGSMGWRRTKDNSIHYEYGGENYTVAQFMLN